MGEEEVLLASGRWVDAVVLTEMKVCNVARIAATEEKISVLTIFKRNCRGKGMKEIIRASDARRLRLLFCFSGIVLIFYASIYFCTVFSCMRH